MATCKGMVVVSGVTYRINESRGGYEVIRLMDDRRLGRFGAGAALDELHGVAPETIVAVARAALREGRVQWVQAVAPARLHVRAVLRLALGEVVSALSAAVERLGWLVRSRTPVPARVSALGTASRSR